MLLQDNGAKLKEYLNGELRFVDHCDIKFLEKEVGKIENILVDKIAAQEKEKELKELANPFWAGKHCWLMLFEAMVSDRCRERYLQSGKWGDRREIDGRNSDQKPPEWYDEVASVYNDPNFEPITTAYPELHEDFKDCILLSRDEHHIPQADGAKIKAQLMTVRGQMMKLIANWEQSGNGPDPEVKEMLKEQYYAIKEEL